MPDTETKARRRPWADADIATLVTAYNGGGIEAAHKAFPADIDRVNQKLEELGFIKIDATLKAIIDDLIAEIGKTKPHEQIGRAHV